MFLARLVRITLIAVIFITAYLPITINPEIITRAVDYSAKEE